MTRVLIWIYAMLLRLYPRRFRAEFGVEMQSVFDEAIRDGSGRRPMLRLLCELCDLPDSLVRAYATYWLRGGTIAMNQDRISPSTRWQAFLGMLPFLAFGTSRMIGNVEHAYHLRGLDAEMVVYALALVGLLIGWIRGFPLWSHGYLGWSSVLAWSNTNIMIYGVSNGYRSWIPLAATVLLALLWTRSLQPIKRFLRDIGRDWSRLLLTTYVLCAWMSMLYDENHHPYLLVFMLGSTLVAAGATGFFLRSSTMRDRTLAMAGGFIIAIVISSICSATWDWHAFHGIPKKPTTWYREVWQRAMLLSFWALILFWPAIAELIRRKAIRRIG